MGDSDSGASLFAHLLGQLYFSLGIGMEGVNTYHRVDPGLFNRVDVMYEIGHAVLEPGQVFLEVFFWYGATGDHGWRASIDAMVFQGTDSGGDHRDIGRVSGVAAFDVPEFL